MRWKEVGLLGALSLLINVGQALAKTEFGEEPWPTLGQCTLQSIEGQHSSSKSTYKALGSCVLQSGVGVPWTAEGAYSPKGGRLDERIVLNGNSPYRGTFRASMTCGSDPWLAPWVELTGRPRGQCSNPRVASDGEVAAVRSMVDTSAQLLMRTPLPATSRFRYDRGVLAAKHDADLAAEAAAQAAALARANKNLQQGAPRVQPVVGPTIQMGTPGPPFLSNTSVPMKIAPPQGVAATGYLVRIESRNAQGVWTLVTNLPVSAAEASSPSGYLGWGAPGPGRGAAMIAGPGTYRVSAQVSAPRPTAWSLPVEFVVTSPKKAIQKAPKAFGP